jgi:hypothetical protein
LYLDFGVDLKSTIFITDSYNKLPSLSLRHIIVRVVRMDNSLKPPAGGRSKGKSKTKNKSKSKYNNNGNPRSLTTGCYRILPLRVMNSVLTHYEMLSIPGGIGRISTLRDPEHKYAIWLLVDVSLATRSSRYPWLIHIFPEFMLRSTSTPSCANQYGFPLLTYNRQELQLYCARRAGI